MALFNKLFSSHKRKTTVDTPTKSNSKKFPFSNDQVRILLYRECDWQGKKLLFDSTALQKINSPASSNCSNTPLTNINNKSQSNEKNFIDISNGYRYNRPQRTDTMDHNVIGEMIFGSVAMSFRGTAFKVHWLNDPTRILCSQVFLSPVHTNRFSIDHISDNLAMADMETGSFNSFSLAVSVCVGDQLSGNSLNVNSVDCTTATASTCGIGVGQTVSDYTDTVHSIAYSDSGYSGTDPWTLSSSSFYPFSSTRSSVSSAYSDKEVRRKLSTDSLMPEYQRQMAGATTSRHNDSNLQRRVQRHMSTSLENKFTASDSIGYFDENLCHTSIPMTMAASGGSDGCVIQTRRGSEQQQQTECRSNPEFSRKKTTSGEMSFSNSNFNTTYMARSRPSNRRVKLGLAVCITLADANAENEMELFCAEHSTLLETMLCRLRAKVENAYLNKKNFYQHMLNAWFTTTEWITDLFTAPRVEKPIWLSLSSGLFNEPAQLAQQFMTELCFLLTLADTKDTNFFISTLLTTILTYHLGWVGTIAPLTHCRQPPDRETAVNAALAEKTKMSEISRFRPYNPLWAQLGDLYGAIGNPPKISKTIVSGSQRTTIDKVLNVLTYFIRCGEIRRQAKSLQSSAIDKIEIDRLFEEFKATNSYQENNRNNLNVEKEIKTKKIGATGLVKSATCVKDLNVLNESLNNPPINELTKEGVDDAEFRNVLVTFKKNDIPNVLVFRDSRFVQQELRIGNFQMDTGIEMTWKQKSDIQNYQIKASASSSTLFDQESNTDHIQFLITSPDEASDNHDDENDDHNSNKNITTTKTKSLPSNSRHNSSDLATTTVANDQPISFFWAIESMDKLKKELKIEKWLNRNENYASDQSSSARSSSGESLQREKELKRSKSLFTKSTNAKNIDHVKKYDSRSGVKSKQQSLTPNDTMTKEPENSTEGTLKSCPSLSDLITANSVGISERLTWGIERVKEAVSYEEEKHFEFAKNMIEQNRSKNKTGGGVIFVLGENEELIGLTPTVSLKSDCDGRKNDGAPAVIPVSVLKSKNKTMDKATTATNNVLDDHRGSNLKSINEQREGYEDIEFGEDAEKMDNKFTTTGHDPKLSTKPTIQLINLPMADSFATENDYHVQQTDKHYQLQIPGFIPSLFVGITDHYIADVVLQGTLAPVAQWEATLKQNLALSSHCATNIEQMPTENVAIIANTDNWDIQIISSQNYNTLQCAAGANTMSKNNSNISTNGGMSQLVATMLETVHVMWTAGTSAYHCMSYIESKLRELYLHSEVLATFLLATEFCSLNTVTSTLNLSVNDVPLLLSIASIHSPQVTKKCGLSFR